MRIIYNTISRRCKMCNQWTYVKLFIINVFIL
ncbi:unnamed protein product [Schistosoma curassoni]|uniref:Uncharacterized protein n=1 Tax=Schistosoma curassoni TaxID=6186 RepID=A0A183KHM4_9TREM|nr:unnamed protein product [Schistosoma curassoni]